MTDWADEKAERIMDEFAKGFQFNLKERIAKALREVREQDAKLADQYPTGRGADPLPTLIRKGVDAKQDTGVFHEGCNYMGSIGHVCNKCGQLVHDGIVRPASFNNQERTE